MDPQFKAVCFDLYGTLTIDFAEADRVAMVTACASAVGAPLEPFHGLWDASMSERLLGREGLRDSVERICRLLGVSANDEQLDEAVRQRYVHQQKYFQIPRSTVETLKLVAHHGYPMGLVSAATEESSVLFARSPLAPFFQATVFSNLVGIMKPDPAIFSLAAERLGVDARDCLYIADGAFGELSGAQQAGMTPVLFRRHDGLSGDDVHRPDSEADTWTGESIIAVAEVLRLLC